MPESGLRALDEGLADVADAKRGLVRRYDVVIDDRGQVERDIILGHAHLTRHLHNLDLDVDLDEALGQRVDLDQARVDGAHEAAEFGDQADVPLGDGLVGVGAADAAGDGAEETNALAECVYWGEVNGGATQVEKGSTYSLSHTSRTLRPQSRPVGFGRRRAGGPRVSEAPP